MQKIICFNHSENILLSELIDMESHTYFLSLLNQDFSEDDLRTAHPAFQNETIRKHFLSTSSVQELKEFLYQLEAYCAVLSSDDMQEISVMSLDSKYYLLQSFGFPFPKLNFSCRREYRGEQKKYKNLSSNAVEDVILHSKLSSTTSSIVVDAKECYTDYVFDIYDIGSIYDLLSLEYSFLLKEEKNIKHCKSCNRFFLSTGKEDLFCNSPMNHPTCKESQKETERKHEIQAIYRRVYKTYFEQTRTGKLEKEVFESWREKAKEYRKNALKDGISPDNFKSQIQKMLYQ